MAADAKVGVYLCECGGNIGDVVDVEEIRKKVRGWDHVAVARKDSYLCSKPAQDTILADIERHGLDRVVVASCTPRMHLPTFQDVLKRAGLNPYLLEFSNIREQCSWVHGPHASEEATRKRFVYLCTNGLLLEKKMEQFRPSPYLTFSLHLDGGRQHHDAAVDQEGVFDRAVAVIRAARRQGFRVTVNCTLFADAEVDETAGFFTFVCDDLGVEG
ncbi:radical SAM protein, partial [Candidatus Bathyarchaeota archaeon]|nr:radical SAM protein [Candidatus Bathyarchaeota archaeon]